MAASNGSCNNTFGSKLQREVVQTVMPRKPTDPRKSIRVSIDEDPSSGIYKRCFNIVLCYKEYFSEDGSGISCGSVVAGWIKESLGMALSEQPMLGGRLRRNQDDQQELEMVSNDSGVRMIEAKSAITLSEFLDLKEKKEAETELVFWEDIDRQNPLYSPLFYVQVTNFTCGGYSIGISYSLLLIDPFAMISFLKRWTDIHIEMVSRTDAPKIPLFYRSSFGNYAPTPGAPLSSNTKPYAGQSLIFTIGTEILDLDSDIHEKFAALCIDEAELKLGQKTAPNLNFSLLVKEPSKEIKVRNFTRDGLIQTPFISVNGINVSATWDDLGASEICFREGHKPAYASYWMNSVPDDAFMMIFPSPGNDNSGMKIVITLPV